MMHTRHNYSMERQLQRDLAEEEGFALIDSDLRYLAVNEAMAAINRLPVADHLGRTVAEVLPTLAPTLEPLLRQVLHSGEPMIDIEIQGPLLADDSTQRWLASYYPVRSRGGPIVAIDVIVRVLPARPWPHGSSMSLIALRERERFVASIADASPYLIYVYDLATNRNRYTNHRLETFCGYTQAELDAMGPGFLFRLIHPDDMAGVLGQADRLRAATDGQVLEHEYRFRHKDGSWRWLCSHELIFQRDIEGVATQVLGIAEDITARKEAEATLRWQASLIEHSHEAVLVWNLDGTVVFWSRGAERLYGYSRTEAVGQRSDELLQTQQRHNLPWIIAALDRTGSWSGELTRTVRDGRELVVASYMTLLTSPDGQRQVLETNRDITTRKAAELALQASEQRWRFALRAAGMVAWEIDLVTNTITWSPGAEAFFGFSPGALGSRMEDLLAVMHPDDRAAAATATERALQEGIYVAEFRLARPDGSLVWVRDQGEVVYDAEGAPQRMLGVSQDITALRAAQDNLRVSEERFRVALQGSPVVIFNQDRDLRYTWLHNPALGYSTEEAIGVTDYDLLERREDADFVMALKRQVLEDGIGRRHEVQIWGEGTMKFYDLTIEPLLNADGQVEGITCAGVDITTSKHSEQALKQANERLLLALNCLDGFMYEDNAHTGRVERSDGMARVLGYAPDEVPTTTSWWIEQIHPDDRELLIQQTIALLESDKASYSNEYRVRHKNGQYRTMLDRGVIERDEQGQVVRVLGTTIDITERKQADAERAELLIRERQAHRATEAALARAEAATRERDLLISIAAHDLRTPLTVILGQAQLLQRRAVRAGLDERSQHILVTITEQAERLNQMVATLLDLSRIQEGRLTIQPEPLELGTLLGHVVTAVQSTVTIHELVLRAPDQFIILHADPLRLEQVFLNLLGNAVKYSPNGGTITIWTECDERLVRVHIRDQGIGIPDEALPHLFARFYRAPNATQQTISSLGVGLFIVREIVQAHGGTITVTSAVDNGSTFTVCLPVQGVVGG